MTESGAALQSPDMSQIDRQSCRSADRTPSGICQCTTFPKSGSALVARVFTRLIGLFVALSAATAASNALAIGLGEIRTDSRLGQILRLEIPLQAAANEEIDEGCFRLVSTPASAGDAAVDAAREYILFTRF